MVSTLTLVIGGVVLLVLIVILAVIVLLYNGLVGKRNRVQDASAQIDVQLKRRYDLIPNLVETVKGYMKYERGVLTQVTQLRSSIITGNMQDKAAANNQLSQALKSIFAVAENYPQLKADETYKNLQEQLMDTEDKIAFVRTSYNDYVLDYNNAVQQFPSSMIAGAFHFSRTEFFQAPEAEKEPIKVDLTSDAAQQQGQAAAQAQAPEPAAAKPSAAPKRGRKPKAPKAP
jgi:LemA protein